MNIKQVVNVCSCMILTGIAVTVVNNWCCVFPVKNNQHHSDSYFNKNPIH